MSACGCDFGGAGFGGTGGATPTAPAIYSPPEQWVQLNVPANQAGVAMNTLVSQNFNDIIMIRAGSIVGMRDRFSQTITAGQIIVQVSINGVVTLMTLVHTSAVLPNGGGSVRPVNEVPYAAGDRIGVIFTTNAGFLPVTTDLEVWVQLAETL